MDELEGNQHRFTNFLNAKYISLSQGRSSWFDRYGNIYGRSNIYGRKLHYSPLYIGELPECHYWLHFKLIIIRIVIIRVRNRTRGAWLIIAGGLNAELLPEVLYGIDVDTGP